MHMIELKRFKMPHDCGVFDVTSPAAPAVDSLILDADAPGSAAKMADFTREGLALQYVVVGINRARQPATEPAA